MDATTHMTRYGRLAAMAVFSFISMYVLMYAIVDTPLMPSLRKGVARNLLDSA